MKGAPSAEVAVAVLAMVVPHLPIDESERETSLARFEDLGGSARSRVTRFLAVRGGRSWSFVLKAPVERGDGTAEWTDRTGRLGNEVAALSFLEAELGVEELKKRGVVARMVGANVALGIIVLEEIAPVRGRLDGLLRGEFKVQGGSAEAVLRLALALAHIHGASAGCERLQRYQRIRDATGCKSKAPPDAAASVAALVGMANQLGLRYDCESFARQMQSCFESSFAADGDFSSLIHADLCPDNVMVLNKRGDVCVLDFEFCRPGNSLMDVSFLRLGFPTCWCAGPLSRATVRAAERAYRAAGSVAIPAVADKSKWRMAMAQCSALWTWGFVRGSLAKDIMAADVPMSRKNADSPTRRQMMLFRLRVASKALAKAGEEMRSVSEATAALRDLFEAMWPNLKPLKIED